MTPIGLGRRIATRIRAGRNLPLEDRLLGSDPTTFFGVGAAVVGLPAILPLWAPGWFVWCFMAAFVVIQLAAMLLGYLHRSHAASIHFVETILTGALLALLPWSIRWFDPDPASRIWLAAALAISYVAAESSVKPHLPMSEWRTGSVIVVLSNTIALALPFAGLGMTVAFVLIAGGTVVSGSRTREILIRLEHERKGAEAEREHADAQRQIAETRAIRDPLTELLNRRGLTIELERNASQPVSVLIVDADQFKGVNDTWGHGAGDEALRAIARTLRARLPQQWQLGRLGGDEFAAVAAGHHELPPGFTNRVSFSPDLTSHPIALELGLSVGLTHADGNATADQLLSQAGYALRVAKRTPGVQSRTLEGRLESKYRRSNEVRAMLSASLDSGEFFPVIQSIVDTRRGIIGGELLARWVSKDGQVLLPAEFIPLLAESGMLPELGSQMLRHGVQFAARFNHLVHGPHIGVNLSASHLALPELCPYVDSLLGEFGVSPDRILIEITESESLDRVDGWEASAKQLRSLGVGLAIDDFGSGYSNVERITSLPISHLKLDRSFTTRVSGSYGEIVRGVINFANATHLGVIAEGIETFDQKVAMEAIGVTTMQGFWFDRPDSLDVFEQQVLSQRFADEPEHTAKPLQSEGFSLGST